jgi:protein O-mannosyl-transferase
MRRKRQKTPGSPSSASPARRRFFGLNFRTLAGAVFLAGIIFIVYSPSLTSGFILDDDKLVTDNSCVLAPDGLYRIWLTAEPLDYWPVTNSMFWIEWRLWGMHPLGYHLVNVMLHVAAALLVWAILRKLSIPGAFLAALLFAVHPVNVESVAWIAQRKDALAIVFFLLSILWYLKADVVGTLRVPSAVAGTLRVPSVRSGKQTADGTRSVPTTRWGWYFLSLLAFLLAMLSKGSAAPLPALLLGITWWRRKLTERDLLRIAPFFVMAAVLAYVNVWFQHHHAGPVIRKAGELERVLGAGVVVWFYLSKAILPINLRFIYPLREIPTTFVWWLPLIAAVLVTVVLVGAAFRWSRSGWSRALLFAWGFFCVSLIPVMGFADVGFMEISLVADHYQHIAIIAVVTLAAAGWAALHARLRTVDADSVRLAAAGTAANDPASPRTVAPQWQWLTYTLAMLVVGTLGVLSWRQNERFQDPIALYRDAVKHAPECWLIQNNLGNRLLAEANKLVMSGDPQGALKDRKEAIEHYNKALEFNRYYSQASNNLANTLVSIGSVKEAIPNYLKALERYRNELNNRPDEPEFRIYTAQVENNLGNALARLGQLPEAIDHYQKAIVLMPDAAKIHKNLADAFAVTGDKEKAYNHYQKAVDSFQRDLELQPNLLEVYGDLTETLDAVGENAKAIAVARKGLELARSAGQTAMAEQFERWLSRAATPPPEPPRATPP